VNPPFATQIGEGFVGAGPDAAHINSVLGALGGPVEIAWASALAQPSAGHTPFMVVAQPGLVVKPLTLFVNKAAIVDDRHGELTWGAAQAGVARGVVDALTAGVVDPDLADDLLLIVAVWVNPAATDAAAVFANNAAATLAALQAGRDRSPAVADVVAARDAIHNPYFHP
jgi:5,6,7,8-tetrahydromethanopterin hydro-lyase